MESTTNRIHMLSVLPNRSGSHLPKSHTEGLHLDPRTISSYYCFLFLGFEDNLVLNQYLVAYEFLKHPWIWSSIDIVALGVVWVGLSGDSQSKTLPGI